MFDLGASELLLIVIVAVIVIGPKDLPLAMRTAGRWVGKVRRVSSHFRSGIDAMIREAELEEMEKKWREQNEAIMKAHPDEDGVADAVAVEGSAESRAAVAQESPAERSDKSGEASKSAAEGSRPDPQLPLPPP